MFTSAHPRRFVVFGKNLKLLKRLGLGAAILGLGVQAGTARAASPLPNNDARRPVRLPEVVVNSSEQPEGQGVYGQPGWVNRSRTSPLTNGYVLSPFNLYAGLIWEGIAPRKGKGTNLFNQEIEFGLPFRSQIAVENQIEQFGDRVQNKTTSVEIRYALADWNKIPLNPTIFGEWKFGTGREFHEEEEIEKEEAGREEGDAGEPEKAESGAEDGGNDEAENESHAKGEHEKDSHGRRGKPRTPDSYELRLLLSQEFGDDFQWSLNAFFEQEVGRDREREIGFSQSLIYAPENCPVQVGIEMQFISKTKKDSRNHPENSFVLGPSIGYQFTPRARIDLAPLFGIGESSPRVDAFVVVSYLFGGPAEKEAHQPISTLNR